MQRLFKPVLLLISCFVLVACVATYKIYEQGETLVLTDRSKIPCQIIDFDGVDIYFHARNGADAYRYGEFIAVGNVAAVHVVRGGQVYSYGVMEYLNKKFPTEKPVAEVTEDSSAPIDESDEEFSEPAETVSETPYPELRVNIGGFLSDSLAKVRSESGIGLNLTERLKPVKTERPIAFDEIAELVITSGATGLLLYRTDKFNEAGAELTDAQQNLIDAIQNAESWDERKKSLRSAHKIASQAFAKIGKRELRQAFRFRASGDSDPFIQFLIFLHKQGDLHNRVKFDRAADPFGDEAAGAMSDILINFDDWYYLVVIQLKR